MMGDSLQFRKGAASVTHTRDAKILGTFNSVIFRAADAALAAADQSEHAAEDVAHQR